MFLKIQAAFRAIENELDPDKAALRNSAFREYDTNRKDSSGNAFKSRRGAKTHVSRKRPTNQRNATGDEVYEHGRWRQKRSSMDMNRAYTDWSFEDRVMITLLCM